MKVKSYNSTQGNRSLIKIKIRKIIISVMVIGYWLPKNCWGMLLLLIFWFLIFHIVLYNILELISSPRGCNKVEFRECLKLLEHRQFKRFLNKICYFFIYILIILIYLFYFNVILYSVFRLYNQTSLKAKLFSIC